MPSQVHDVGLRLCTELYMTMGATRFFTLDKLKMLAMGFGTDNVLPRSGARERAPNTVAQRDKKTKRRHVYLQWNSGGQSERAPCILISCFRDWLYRVVH